jgi:hypothetical protein
VRALIPLLTANVRRMAVSGVTAPPLATQVAGLWLWVASAGSRYQESSDD